jgi:hypothetical protein
VGVARRTERERQIPLGFHNEKPSLSVCAFGAVAVHAALLALVLPIVITLPAPADKAEGTVTVQVVMRSKLPPPLEAATAEPVGPAFPAYIGEGDVDEDAVPLVSLGETTVTLPEVSSAPAETLPLVDSVPAPQADVRDDAIAYIDSKEAPISETRPAIVTKRSRKPPQASIPEQQAKPAASPRRRVSATRAPATRPVEPAETKPAYKGLLGGTKATTMPEYPFADR